MKIAMIAVDRIDHVTALARELGRQGHEVTVHTRREQPGEGRTSIGDGVVVEPIAAGPERPLSGPDLLPHLADFGQRLADSWKGDAPDVAHAHGWASGLAALAASQRLDGDVPERASGADLLAGKRLPLLQSYGRLAAHGADVDPAAQARLERALGRAAVGCTVGCEEDREKLVRLGVPRSRIKVVPGGVDTDEFTERGPVAPRNERHRLLMLCGPTDEAAVAIRALVRIPDTELVITGRGSADDEAAAEKLRALAGELGVADRVILLERVSRGQVPGLIRSADLVLALDGHDPYGTVALEAMACGVPVVAHRAGGHLDTVVDEVTGLLVPRLSPVELARRVRTLLADSVRREALGIAAADRARSRHSWERIARETIEVYETIS